MIRDRLHELKSVSCVKTISSELLNALSIQQVNNDTVIELEVDTKKDDELYKILNEVKQILTNGLPPSLPVRQLWFIVHECKSASSLSWKRKVSFLLGDWSSFILLKHFSSAN